MQRWQEPRGRALLDVGCAHGWFLKAASGRGYETTGVEPDAGMVALARMAGLDVRSGFFPDALEPETVFDVITFNDVFEHLPDVDAALDACRERLRKGGLVVLNIPNSGGAVFRVASLLDRIGIRGPLDRLWQKDFPSPHLSYFNPDCLAALMRLHGFRELYRGELATVELQGLWQRLRYDRTSSLPASLLTWLGVSLAFPVLHLLTSDISLLVFVKEPPGAVLARS
jgi:SAM-dependent methyltransferase